MTRKTIHQRVWLGTDDLAALQEQVNKAIEEHGLEPVGDPYFECGTYHQELVKRQPEDAPAESVDREAMLLDGTMKLVATYRDLEAQRFVQEPPPHGAGWPEVADVVATIYVYERKPHEYVGPPSLLLAYDAEGNSLGDKAPEGWG
jgi:hypothetical protein